LILHAGDVYDAATLDQLAVLAPVLCARGSEDTSLDGDDRVRDRQVLTLDGVRIGLLHALDYPIPEWRPLDRVLAREFGGPVDVLIFGDSHVPVIERVRVGAPGQAVQPDQAPLLLVNPGSPTLPHGRPGAGTVAILSTGSFGIQAELIQL
jgi:putative phosphoesterase